MKRGAAENQLARETVMQSKHTLAKRGKFVKEEKKTWNVRNEETAVMKHPNRQYVAGRKSRPIFVYSQFFSFVHISSTTTQNRTKKFEWKTVLDPSVLFVKRPTLAEVAILSLFFVALFIDTSNINHTRTEKRAVMRRAAETTTTKAQLNQTFLLLFFIERHPQLTSEDIEEG